MDLKRRLNRIDDKLEDKENKGLLILDVLGKSEEEVEQELEAFKKEHSIELKYKDFWVIKDKKDYSMNSKVRG